MGDRTVSNLRVGDVSLHVTVDGEGNEQSLLFLHGLTDSSAYMEWIGSRLADRFRVVTLDFRGHGRSDRAAHYETPDFLADAVAVADQVAGPGCALVAHSFGGMIGAALAQQRPDLVRAIFMEDPLLVDPGVRTDRIGDDGAYARDIFTGAEAHFAMIAGWQRDGLSPEEAAAAMASMPSPQGVPWSEGYFPESIRALAEGKLQFDVRIADDFATGRDERDAAPVYDHGGAIDVPGFLLAGDPSVPGTRTREIDIKRLEATSPLIEHETVPGAGHFIHDERSSRDAYVRALERFLENLGN